MSQEFSGERLFVVDELSKHLAEGRVTRAELLNRLQPAELALIDQRATGAEIALDYPWSSFQRMVTALDWVESRTARPLPARVEGGNALVLGEHGTVAHELLDLAVLMIGFDSNGRLLIFDLLRRAYDTRFRFAQATNAEEIPAVCSDFSPDVILVDLSLRNGLTFDVLARSELLALDRPLVILIQQTDEPKALHMGDRQYLLKGELQERLLVRTLRNAHERHQLERGIDESQRQARDASTHDAMTGLPNRLFLRDRLEQALERAQRYGQNVAVLFLDLDRFKSINDTLGHDVGDALLHEVSARLTSTVASQGTVARVGGDEFLAMLVGPPGEFAPQNMAGRILDALARPIQIDDLELGVTASIGIARYPQDGSDPETLIRNADMALYQVKDSGRDGFQLFSQRVGDIVTRKAEVENRLRRALDDDGLDIYYQPRVDLTEQRIVGCEALLRWNDPELGQIAPDEFVAVAEESGLIRPLGDWIFRNACRQWRAWTELGHRDMRLSVNLSAYQIIEGHLRESILRTLWDTGLDPSRVEIEITETALIQNRDGARRVLQELKELGLWLSLDDFGTGFSSLSNLRRFPVDIIKIDQSFVRDILTDPNDAALTEAILSIGEKLGLKVVAEGVESIGQRDFLFERGCTEMQGYLFSRAVPADAFERLLEKGVRNLD